MKNFIIYSGLFLAFVGAQSAVQHLDAYTSHYQLCADKWQESVNLAKGEYLLTSHIKEQLQQQNMIVDGKKCPALQQEHVEVLKARLDVNAPLGLRGLTQ